MVSWDNIIDSAHEKAEKAGDSTAKVIVKANKVGGGILGFLRTANAALEQIPGGIITYFDAIADMGENVSQAFVDAVCRYAAWMVNINIERIRQKVLKSIYDQNIVVRIIVDILEIGKKVILNPLDVIPTFFERLTAPFRVAKEIIVDIVKEISRLSENVTKIMSVLPPDPPNPDINFHEFKIKIYTFGMGALAPSDSFPAPEVLFPQPPSPFGKDTFMEAFAEGKKTFSAETYTVNEKVKDVLYKPKKSIAMEGTVA